MGCGRVFERGDPRRMSKCGSADKTHWQRRQGSLDERWRGAQPGQPAPGLRRTFLRAYRSFSCPVVATIPPTSEAFYKPLRQCSASSNTLTYFLDIIGMFWIPRFQALKGH